MAQVGELTKEMRKRECDEIVLEEGKMVKVGDAPGSR